MISFRITVDQTLYSEGKVLRSVSPMLSLTVQAIRIIPVPILAVDKRPCFATFLLFNIYAEQINTSNNGITGGDFCYI